MINNGMGPLISTCGRVVVLGVGGIGSWVLEPLTRMLISLHWEGELMLIDDDIVELKNLNRQGFLASDSGVTKVSAWHRRLMPLISGTAVRITAYPQRIVENNVDTFITENSIVLLCPDNHEVRALVADHASKLDNIIVVTAGNELFNGNVHVLVRLARVDVTQNLRDRHPEVFRPGTASQMAACSDLVDKGNTQILLTNYMAAMSALLAFRGISTYLTPINDKEFVKELPQEIFFNALTGKLRAATIIRPAPVLVYQDPAEKLEEVKSVLTQHSVHA